jgi:hypothetical protein
MMPHQEVTLQWTVGKEKVLGAKRIVAVNLERILNEGKKETPRNNLLRTIQNRLTDLLMQQYPQLSHVTLRLTCFITEDKDRKVDCE